MGVYIPNMEMPKNCFQCSFNDGIYCCLIDTDTDALIPKMPTERLPLCPLIEIDDEIWENESHKLIRMTNEARINKAMAERRADVSKSNV